MSKERKEIIIGRCIGESSPAFVSFVTKEMPQIGDYVIVEYDKKEVLGLITGLVRGNPAIDTKIYDPEVVSTIKVFEGDEFYIHGGIRILGDIENLQIPRTPPPPGTIIKRARTKVLKEIFQTDSEECIHIGHLISNPEVSVAIDVNKMVSRHLSVLAITGAGKSNSVAVIVDELLKLPGCVLMFDMHSEYVLSKFTNGGINVIPSNLNPRYLTFSELLILLNIPSNAHIQQRYLRIAFKEIRDKMKESGLKKDFLVELYHKLEQYSNNDDNSSDKKSIIGVMNKINDMQIRYEIILHEHAQIILEQIQLGKANIIDLGMVDEDLVDVVVSHVLRTLLQGRKQYKREGKGFPHPVFLVLEEAHILAPADRNPLSKYWISRIAREGRKFGLGLCLVSQRPKIIDSNALSQANNMIILKLVEPGDQRYVQNASETLSEDLMTQLSSLNTGEAILLGMMTKVPALVKIKKFAGTLIGQDINIVKEWKDKHEKSKKENKEKTQEINEIYESGNW